AWRDAARSVASRLSGTWPASRADRTPSGPSSRKRPPARAREDGRASLRAARTAGLLGLVIPSTTAAWGRPSGLAAGAAGAVQALAGAGDQARERARGGDRDVGQDLAVDLDAGRGQAGDEPVVGHALGPGGGVDPGDPQGPEVALARPAVPVGVAQGVHDLLVGGPVGASPAAPVARGHLHGGALGLGAVDGPLDSCHRSSLSLRRIGTATPLQAEHAAHAAPVRGRHLDLATEAALARRGLLLELAVQPRLPADQLAGLGHPEAPCGAPVALHLGHGVSWSYGVRAGGGAWAPPGVWREENTVIMWPPSGRAGLSTGASSTRSVASRSSSRRPSSVWAISRPRNMMVTLTLWPCFRNRSTWPFLVW